MNIKRWLTLAVLSLLAISSPLCGQATAQSQASTSSTQSTTTSGTQKKSDATQTPASDAAEKPHNYTNSVGHRVQSPTKSNTVPAGATAQCRDGSYSFSQTRRGTCSHHGGVSKWLQ